MLDDTLRDYWINVNFYRKQTQEIRKMMLIGQLRQLADKHQNGRVRQLLVAFLTKEKAA